MSQLSSYIEHTCLKQTTKQADILLLCNEAIEHSFYGVCVPPNYVAAANKILKDTDVKVVTVIGFPLGYNLTSTKTHEAEMAIIHGADELDMVLNLTALLNENYSQVQNDIAEVAMIAHLQNKQLKVIIESGILNDDQIVKACELCAAAKVNFVKTSTGFAANGASVPVVKLMRKNLPDSIKIKASGGIKDKAFAEALIAAGADRIGTSSGVNIVTE